jgi:FtsP/CotA-like multicopper oxidase with cupredoxin domain
MSVRRLASLAHRSTRTRIIVVFASWLGTLSAASFANAQPAERVAINDNRRAAGTLEGDTLTIRLEARVGEWRPDGDRGLPVSVKAFAVDGGSLQVPGPLIRVREGTRIRAVVRNAIDKEPIALHGFYTRPGKAGVPTVIPSGEAREFTFVAGSPGSYYYWGANDPKTILGQRQGNDTQLTGALIVDARDAAPDSDRVFVIGNWDNDVPVGQPGRVLRFVINGQSWPSTERLTYRVGETVRMRVMNLGGAVHPMHLHGFYFNVDARGTESQSVVYPPGSSPRMAVTERLAPGQTFALTWKPSRPGKWLFHCHDNVHLDYGGHIDGSPVVRKPHHHVENHTTEMMAGPVMGITVTGTSIEPQPAASATRRRMRLVARVDAGGTDQEPSYGYTLDDGGPTPPQPYLPGPTLLLKRNEPLAITVVNELPEPTAVHWHGIELESYYDGVPDYAGDDTRTAKPIAPGGSFDAHFTPPRSGTFIYHTHLDDTRQQRAGLTGALLVLDDPASYDATRDFVMLVTTPRKAADNGVVLLNGSSTPAAKELKVNERYRFRFINVHIFRPSMRMRLLQGTTLQRWRPIAKDGMDLPADQVLEGPSEIQMGNGETYDFEYMPAAAGEFRVDVTAGDGTLLVTMPIRVRE